MKILWIKDEDPMNFLMPIVFLILGTRGSAKSTLIETIAEFYLRGENKILDLFGSRDGEGLAWLRSPWEKDRKILLIRGDNTDIDSSWDSKAISKVSLRDIEEYDMLISASPLYSDPDTEFLGVANLTDLIYQRLSWRKIVFCLVREASNLYYSRLKITRNQQLAKSQEVYLLREARHMGLAMGMDTLKFTSIDLDVRSVCDYLMFKSLGLLGLPRDLQWLYGYIEPSILRKMERSRFVVVSKTSAAGIGTFSPLPWHKQEKENIVKGLGIEVSHGTPLHYAEDKGGHKGIGDMEHAFIITTYASGLSNDRTAIECMAKFKRRTLSSTTVRTAVRAHDLAVMDGGVCPACHRALSAYDIKVVKRTAD